MGGVICPHVGHLRMMGGVRISGGESVGFFIHLRKKTTPPPPPVIAIMTDKGTRGISGLIRFVSNLSLR